MRVAFIGSVLASLALAGCGRPSAEAPLKQVYRCDGLTVTAEFPAPDRVLLSWAGQSASLKRVPAASGAKYADAAGNEFWTKDGALLTLAGQPVRRCALT